VRFRAYSSAFWKLTDKVNKTRNTRGGQNVLSPAVSMIYASLKSTFSGLQYSVADSTGLSSFVLPLLPLKSAKSRESPRKFELIAVQEHPRSSTLVLIESAYATSYCSFRNITSGFGRHFRWSVIIGIA